VLGSHAEDVWGILLVTLGVLFALGLYGNGLGPVGHGLRHGLGLALGFGRFLVPPACVAAGVLLVAGRPSAEPARPVLGLVLAMASVAGLADLAGGSPRLTAHAARLSAAGGWLGAGLGGPLRAALAGWGATVVFIAVLTLALVLFTGVTLRSVAAGTAAVARSLWEAVDVRLGADMVAEPGLYEDEDGEDFEELDEQDAQDEEEDEEEEVVDDEVDDDELDEEGADEPAGEDAEPAPDPPEPVLETPAPVPAPAGAGELRLGPGSAAGEWRLPPLKLLGRSKQQEFDRSEVTAAGRALVAALGAHGVQTRLVGHTVGPTVTRFELELGPGVKVARVTSLAKDIAYAMASPDVRILAPIPGKSAIGVEVPNRRRQLVTLGDVLSSEEARRVAHPLEVALGRDIAGRPVIVNLADMPHILISGATGAGKSSCINSLLTSVLMHATPEQVRLILVDPKRVELGQYNGLPHLLTQVVVDPKKAANALSWAVTEMERRYDVLAEAGMRDITGYNEAIERGELDEDGPDDLYDLEDEEQDDVDDEVVDEDDLEDEEDEDDVDEADDEEEEDEEFEEDDVVDEEEEEEEEEDDALEDDEVGARVAARVAESRAVVEPRRQYERLPFVLVVVDELNDLMMVAARDVEESVCRIAQMARAVGIHLVLATQRPSVDVITGVIKANIPSRLAFSVSSLADSRVILDQPGAERLIGKGDMLLLTASSSVPRRIQGPWVAESEVRAVVGHWRRQRQPEYVAGVAGGDGPSAASGALDEDDELLSAAMELVVRSQLGSTSMLQRKLRLGFSRAGRLMDLLERRGVVGPSEGSKARAVLMTVDELEQLADR